MALDTIAQLKKMIDNTEFSDRVKDKIKEIIVKAQLRKKSGLKDKECLTDQEKKTLKDLIAADMVLDAIEVKACQASLKEIDKVLARLK